MFVETGFRGGASPYALVSLNSMVGEYLLAQAPEIKKGVEDYRADFTPFDSELLSPARTLFEKLLHLYTCLRGDVTKPKTRHIYDVVQIFRKQEEVRALIATGEYRELLKEAILVSNTWYGAKLVAGDVKLREGLVMSAEQANMLAKAYNADEVCTTGGNPRSRICGLGWKPFDPRFPVKRPSEGRTCTRPPKIYFGRGALYPALYTEAAKMGPNG